MKNEWFLIFRYDISTKRWRNIIFSLFQILLGNLVLMERIENSQGTIGWHQRKKFSFTICSFYQRCHKNNNVLQNCIIPHLWPNVDEGIIPLLFCQIRMVVKASSIVGHYKTISGLAQFTASTGSGNCCRCFVCARIDPTSCRRLQPSQPMLMLHGSSDFAWYLQYNNVIIIMLSFCRRVDIHIHILWNHHMPHQTSCTPIFYTV